KRLTCIHTKVNEEIGFSTYYEGIVMLLTFPSHTDSTRALLKAESINDKAAHLLETITKTWHYLPSFFPPPDNARSTTENAGTIPGLKLAVASIRKKAGYCTAVASFAEGYTFYCQGMEKVRQLEEDSQPVAPEIKQSAARAFSHAYR